VRGAQNVVALVHLYRISEGFQDLIALGDMDVYIGIISEDSSIVYYKISPGIVKPNN
jgi:hypothetical protein